VPSIGWCCRQERGKVLAGFYVFSWNAAGQSDYFCWTNAIAEPNAGKYSRRYARGDKNPGLHRAGNCADPDDQVESSAPGLSQLHDRQHMLRTDGNSRAQIAIAGGNGFPGDGWADPPAFVTLNDLTRTTRS